MTLGGFAFSQLSNDVRARLRRDMSLSQADIARASGVAPATITRLLKGHVIGVGPTLRLCKWLGQDAWHYMEDELFDAEPAKQEVRV
ncbi:MAG: helix-turn-helix domain-containing protein [Pseudomonadota bacterium]